MEVEILDTGGNWNPITHLIAYQGWKTSRNDIDGPNAGRNQLGNMIRDRVAQKYRHDVTLIPITKQTVDWLNDLLNPVEFYIRYKDDHSTTWTQELVYSNNYSWTYCQKKADGREYYNGFSFPFVEI